MITTFLSTHDVFSPLTNQLSWGARQKLNFSTIHRRIAVVLQQLTGQTDEMRVRAGILIEVEIPNDYAIYTRQQDIYRHMKTFIVKRKYDRWEAMKLFLPLVKDVLKSLDREGDPEFIAYLLRNEFEQNYLRDGLPDFTASASDKAWLRKAIHDQQDPPLTYKPPPGYFPTPAPLVANLVTQARIKPGMTVLEPSAGSGHIADALLKTGARVDVIEIHPELRKILIQKGFLLVGGNFLDYDERTYDRIVMNPPFEKNQDIDHVMHAYELLAPGGRLVAIMSEHPFFATDKKAKEFRDWLKQHHGESVKNPEGSFKQGDVKTGVNTRIVWIDKPNARSNPRRKSETDVAPPYPFPLYPKHPTDADRATWLEAALNTQVPVSKGTVTLRDYHPFQRMLFFALVTFFERQAFPTIQECLDMRASHGVPLRWLQGRFAAGTASEEDRKDVDCFLAMPKLWPAFCKLYLQVEQAAQESKKRQDRRERKEAAWEAAWEAQAVVLDSYAMPRRSSLQGKRVWLYHGTTTALWPEIQKHGLRPGRDVVPPIKRMRPCQAGLKSNFSDRNDAIRYQPHVFLTARELGDASSAQWYARQAAYVHGGDPLILRVAIDWDDLSPDPDDQDIAAGRYQFVIDQVPPENILEANGTRYPKGIGKP